MQREPGTHHVPTRQVKVGVGPQGAACDFRRSRLFERRATLTEAGRAIFGRRFETQQGLERAPVHYAVSIMPLGLEAE
jgi:hypothetical protein